MIEHTGLYEAIQLAITEAMSNLHTSTPAKVTQVGTDTISAKPLISRFVNGKKIDLPEFIEVPLVTLQGGASYLHFPIAVGDEVLLIISERCFDSWYAGNDYAQPLEFRMHDYSDSFAIVGINSKGKAITIPSITTLIGDVHKEGNHDQTGNNVQTGDYDLTGDMTINGNLTVNGDIGCTGKLTVSSALIGGIEFGTHGHPQSADSAGDSQSNTGNPV